jgi:hypothetical protein
MRVGKMGAFAGLAALVGINRLDCGDDTDETTVDKDSLELQKEQGWNFGSTDKPLKFTDTVLLDSKGTVDWSNYLDAIKLQNAYRNAAWQPYVVPTLVQSLSQSSLKSQLKPINSQAMKEAYARGLGMKDLLAKSKDKTNIMMMIDLPGPESVAFGAALADTADVVITFDNWPHPLGVVPSHQTLGAMLFYAQEMSDNSVKRPDKAPAVFLLDSNRLNAYTDADNQFDNRYVAKIPAADTLKNNHVNSVFYVMPNETRKMELDDLNDDFASFKDRGIAVALLPMTNFQKPALAQDTTRTKASGHVSAPPQNVYYYGGGPSLWPYFFMHYAMTPSYRMPSYSSLPSTSVGRPSYTPTPRPTIFSSRSVGGVSGVGRQKPTGFGRVSTNVNSAGKVTSVRSGSFSRSGGRSSG